MLRCSATRAMTRTLHEPWPKPKRPPSARDPPSQSAAPPENRRVNQPETVSAGWSQTEEHVRDDGLARLNLFAQVLRRRPDLIDGQALLQVERDRQQHVRGTGMRAQGAG